MIRFFASFRENNISFESSGCNTCKSVDGKMTLLSQGLLAKDGKHQTAVLEQLLAGYQQTGTLNVDGIEGSFVLALLDEEKQTAILYRNVVGSHFVYYTALGSTGTRSCFTFGSNLADVARSVKTSVNEEMLPVLFWNRQIPGHNTLFSGIFKLRPGEMVRWQKGTVQRTQHRTMDMFDEPHKTNEEESIDRAESTLRSILAEWYAIEPKSIVLLSGGVDSTLLQVYWSEIWNKSGSGKPPSACVVLNHPSTKEDLEYTLSAVKQLDTEHTSIRQEPLTADFMRKILSQTGEMPSHVQSFYFATLAEGLRKAGWQGTVFGQGADGMFGYYPPDDIITAAHYQKKYPMALYRSVLASVFDIIKPGNSRSPKLRLANHLYDLDYPHHPQNSVAAFTNFATHEALFGKQGMLKAMEYRRSILDDLHVPKKSETDPLGLLRAQMSVVFAEVIETAAYWSAMIQMHDIATYTPFLDSRTIRTASNIALSARFVHGNPKQVLKKTLGRHVPAEFMKRPKRGYGQPIFEWLSPGGTLYDAVQSIGDYAWLPKEQKRQIIEKPTWVLWTLLCFDLWYKEFFK